MIDPMDRAGAFVATHRGLPRLFRYAIRTDFPLTKLRGRRDASMSDFETAFKFPDGQLGRDTIEDT
jgi:hypothetical protein